MSNPRFEVVRTDAGYHARYKAANGRIGWTTEVYKTSSAAESAVRSLVAGIRGVRPDSLGIGTNKDGDIFFGDVGTPGMRRVDERTSDPADLPPEEAGQALLRTPIDTPEET